MRVAVGYFIGILMLCAVSFVFANQINQAQLLFYQGNTNYSQEKFDEAIADYEGALTLGLESGPLYFNLGNTYFKQGSLGKAILNYLRARRLIADDADLNSNLEYAQSLIKGGKIPPQRNWFSQTFFYLTNAVTLDGITLTCVSLYFSVSVFLILIILVKRLRKAFKYLGSVMIIAFMISVSLFLGQFYQNVIYRQAVVIADEVEFKFEPFEDATTFFSLNEGESVVVGKAKDEWVKARRSDGKQGWVKQADIELL